MQVDLLFNFWFLYFTAASGRLNSYAVQTSQSIGQKVNPTALASQTRLSINQKSSNCCVFLGPKTSCIELALNLLYKGAVYQVCTR